MIRSGHNAAKVSFEVVCTAILAHLNSLPCDCWSEFYGWTGSKNCFDPVGIIAESKREYFEVWAFGAGTDIFFLVTSGLGLLLKGLIASLIISPLRSLYGGIFAGVYLNTLAVDSFEGVIIITTAKRSIVDGIPVFGSILQVDVGCLVY